METLAEKRKRIKVQKITATAIMEKARGLGYAAGIKVNKGDVILRCSKGHHDGLVLIWGELGVVGVSIYGDTAGPAILSEAAIKVIKSGLGFTCRNPWHDSAPARSSDKQQCPECPNRSDR